MAEELSAEDERIRQAEDERIRQREHQIAENERLKQTDEEIAAHFSAMDDSVKLINATVADDSEALKIYRSAEEVDLMVTRNTDHLEIQAAKYWYVESSQSKASYDDAVAAGKAYVAD